MADRYSGESGEEQEKQDSNVPNALGHKHEDETHRLDSFFRGFGVLQALYWPWPLPMCTTNYSRKGTDGLKSNQGGAEGQTNKVRPQDHSPSAPPGNS